MPRWYVSIDGRASGPFETEEVAQSIRQRKYVLVDLIFQEGGSGWQSFDEVGEFKAIFDEIKAQDESRSQVNSHLAHPWVLLKKVKEEGPDKYLQEGPYSPEEVLNLIQTGQIQYSDYAWKKGFDKWVRIGFIPEFDRMKNLDENSFVDYQIPLPEIADLELTASSKVLDDMMKSVRVFKKDETFYESPEDDPEFEPADLTPPLELAAPQEVEVTSVGLSDFSGPAPAKEQTPAPIVSEDTMRFGLSEEFQKAPLPPPIEPIQDEDESSELAKSDAAVELKSNYAEHKPLPVLDDGPTEVITKPVSFDAVSRTEKISEPKSKPEKKPQVAQVKRDEKTEDEKLSFFAKLFKKNEKPKDKKRSERKLKRGRAPTDDRATSRDFSENTSTTIQPRKKSRNRAAVFLTGFSAFALVAILLAGLYNYRNSIFGENSAAVKWIDSTQRSLLKVEEPQPEVKVAPYHPPPPPSPTPFPTPSQAQTTAALDPNLKAKVENQLESGANQKLPDTNVPPPPQESTRPGQKASYVDLDLRSFSKNSKAVIQTNGSVGTQILLYVSARTGEILTFASYYHEFKVTRKANKPIEVDLSSLAPGKYNIEAEIGDIKKLKVLTVKEDDYNKKIEAHLKQISYEQQKEKKALYYGSKLLETQVKKLYETARASQTQAKEWVGFYSGFKQLIKSSVSPLVTSINDSTRNIYAYPDEIFDLLDVKDNLLKNAEEIDKSIKQKKPIDFKAEQEMIRDLEKIRKRASFLSAQKRLS